MSDSGQRVGSGELFPTDEPVSGGALIGRADDVDAIATSLMGSVNVVLAGPRRVGKTSVARAAVEVCRRAGAYTVAVDLFKQPDAVQLAESLTVAALANRPKARQLLSRARQAPARARQVAAMTATVRLRQELGDAVELAFSPALGEVPPERALRDALELLERIAQADGKRLVLFLDEFQELASPRKPYGHPDAATRQLRAVLQDSPSVTVLFAGSIEHVMRDLFGPAERALSQFGGFYELPPIAAEDWAVGIPARLKLDACAIDDDALAQLVERGEGHPRATMLIAQQAHYVATLEPTRRIDVAHVGAGAERAMIADRLKHEQTLAHIRTLGRHAQRLVERVALGTKLYQGLAPDVANQTLRALRDAGIIEHHGRGEWQIFDPLLRRYLQELPGEARPNVKPRGG
jgi:uncharacterized protein